MTNHTSGHDGALTDYDVLTKLYRRACDATGKRPYLFFVSRPVYLLESIPFLSLYGIPIRCVERKPHQPPIQHVAVARVEMSHQEKGSEPTAFPADWSAMDYCFEAKLDE